MKYFCHLFLLFIYSCVPYGGQVSSDIEDSKKMNVFKAEYISKNKIVKINDTILLDIKEIWLEYNWGYSSDGSGVFYKNNNFQLIIILNKKSGYDKLDFFTIFNNEEIYLRECGNYCLMCNFKDLPKKEIIWKIEKKRKSIQEKHDIINSFIFTQRNF